MKRNDLTRCIFKNNSLCSFCVLNEMDFFLVLRDRKKKKPHGNHQMFFLIISLSFIRSHGQHDSKNKNRTQKPNNNI